MPKFKLLIQSFYCNFCTGDNSPLACNSIESDDRRTPRGHNYALSLGSCLSGAQYEKVIALVERIQPEAAVYVDVMSQHAVEPPSPLLVNSQNIY